MKGTLMGRNTTLIKYLIEEANFRSEKKLSFGSGFILVVHRYLIVKISYSLRRC